MTEHTSSPWHTEQQSSNSRELTLCSGSQIIADITFASYPAFDNLAITSEDLANARLIKEAPALFEALEHAVNWGLGFADSDDRPVWLTEAEEALRRAREKHVQKAGVIKEIVKDDITATLYLAEEAGLDPAGGKYVAVCEEHGTLCNFTNKRKAIAHLRIRDWCEICMNEKASMTTSDLSSRKFDGDRPIEEDLGTPDFDTRDREGYD